MPAVIHQVIKPIFLDLHKKTTIKMFLQKNSNPRSAISYRQNVLKIFVFNLIILKWEHQLLLSILLKGFKNAGIKTVYFTNMFTQKNISLIHKNIFACRFSVYNKVSLLRHEQVCLMRLCVQRYLLKYLSEQNLIKHTCSRHDKLITYNKMSLVYKN